MIAPLLAISLPVLFVLSGIETALISVSRVRILHAGKQGDRRAARLSHLYFNHSDQLLTSILILTSAITVLIFAAVTHRLVAPDALGHTGYAATFLVCLPVYLLVAEILPKAFVKRFPFRFLLRSLPVMVLVAYTVLPVVRVVSFLLGFRRRDDPALPVEEQHADHTRADFKALASSIERDGTLGADERHMITNIVDFESATLDQVMVPIARVTSIPADMPLASIRQLASSTGFNQFPVMSPAGTLVGIVDIFEILRANSQDGLAANHAHQIIKVPPRTSPLALLRRLRAQGNRVAAVVSPRGRPLGIVSADDILAHMIDLD